MSGLGEENAPTVVCKPEDREADVFRKGGLSSIVM